MIYKHGFATTHRQYEEDACECARRIDFKNRETMLEKLELEKATADLIGKPYNLSLYTRIKKILQKTPKTLVTC